MKISFILLISFYTQDCFSRPIKDCLKIKTNGGPEDMVLIELSEGERWLITATVKRGIISQLFNKKAYFELIRLDKQGAPDVDNKQLYELKDNSGKWMKPTGFSVLKKNENNFQVDLLNNAGKVSRLETFNLSLPNVKITHKKSINIGNEGKHIKHANDVVVLADGRAIVSNFDTKNYFNKKNKTWIVRNSKGEWVFSNIDTIMPNGVTTFNANIILANYKKKNIVLASLTGNELKIIDHELLDIHPDNFSRNNLNEDFLIAGQKISFMTALHLIFGKWLPSDWGIYRINNNFRITPVNHPKPKGSAAVSTAIENWWCFSQIKRNAIFACKKSS